MQIPDVTHVTEEISPELAEKYLRQNNRNRPISPRKVKQLADDMLAGRYLENGAGGVTFDSNGDLADGQHTLSAVVKSGMTIRCRVTRGVPPEARSTLNDGLGQRFSHDLHVMGVMSSVRVEALLRKILVWEDAAAEDPHGLGGLTAWQNARFSRAELAEAWPKYAEGVSESIRACYRWKDSWRLVGNAGALEFMYWLLVYRYENNPQTVTDFFDRMATGSQEAEDQVLTRVKVRMKRKPDGAPYQVYWLGKAWNAWTRGERVSKLMLPNGRELSDPFPKLQRAR